MRPRGIEVILRFLCGRRGAALARAAILVWSFAGASVGYVGWGLWGEFKAVRDAVQRIEIILAGEKERDAARDIRVNTLATISNETTAEVNDHERRLYRLEGRR